MNSHRMRRNTGGSSRLLYYFLQILIPALSILSLFHLYLTTNVDNDNHHRRDDVQPVQQQQPSNPILLFTPNNNNNTNSSNTILSHHANVMNTFPLVLGDPSLVPINLLVEDNYSLQKQHCKTYVGDRRFRCDLEWDEWMLVLAFVREGDAVMEFGARFATTSCLLNRAVGPTGVVVAVEPDRSVHGDLLQNRYTHNCGFHALLGTVGPSQYYKTSGKNLFYGTQTTTTADASTTGSLSSSSAAAIPHMELSKIESIIGRKINIVLIDCEGCIENVNQTGLLDQVDLILLEEDALDSYGIWHEQMQNVNNFTCLWYLKDTADLSKPHWAKIRHSAWLRKGVVDRAYPTCNDYANQTGLSSNPNRFICSECPDIPKTS